VLDSYLSFPEDKTEWNGTKVVFEIAREGNKTEVRFTHEGLVPDYQCFDKCSSAWGFYINDSLKSLITAGKGDPKKSEHRARPDHRKMVGVWDSKNLASTDKFPLPPRFHQ
jgi:hypothetical protein